MKNHHLKNVFHLFKIYSFVLLLLTSCYKKEHDMKPPIAQKIPYNFDIHEQTINDEYAWLRDKDWPNVTNDSILQYLKQENDYFDHFFLSLNDDKEQIFQELKNRIQLADQSTYVKKDNYYYYHRTTEMQDYPIYCRKLNSTKAQEEIILDINKIADGKKFTRVGAIAVSPDNNLMAYSVDFSGDEKYTIKLYNLQESKYLSDEIPNTIGSIVWHENLEGFFYTPTNENWRHDKVMFHKLGDEFDNDKLVLHETNTLYNVDVSKSSSKQYIFISVSGHDNNEVYFIPMSDHAMNPVLFKAKKESILYDVEHNGKYFYIHTNDSAKNFRIARINATDPLDQVWRDYIAEDQTQYLSDFDITSNYLILNYKKEGLPNIKVQHLDSSNAKYMIFPDTVFTAGAYSTNFDEDDIRVGYSSLRMPHTTYSYNFITNQLLTLKVQKIPSGFDPSKYVIERKFANNNGTSIPITILYKRSLFKGDGSNPLYLYGYGSYGISAPISFRNSAISLVNRGFVYAVAHIRGGDDLGHDWYEAAKLLNKKLTFEDFIAVANNLIINEYTSKGNIAICGGSAGGLLIGAVLNARPELFKAAILHVPFVDVVNSMLDDTLPLTPGEFTEWGNPKESREHFEYMFSYSPYDNIKYQNYPAIMVTAGISDPRVGYWEAAKWVARIREKRTDDNLLIFKTNMNAGHAGASGRFDFLKETADDLVFIFQMFNLSID